MLIVLHTCNQNNNTAEENEISESLALENGFGFPYPAPCTSLHV